MSRLTGSNRPGAGAISRDLIIISVFCLIPFILVLLVLLAGVNNSLTSIYHLKTDASKLSIPSKLSTSTFLSDLSQVSGADYTGQPQTPSTLGIAELYTIHLLTACGHFRDGGISCSKPSFGFSFHPGTTLRLDSTALQRSSGDAYSVDLLSSLSRYAKLSSWLAGAYLVSAIFLGLTIGVVNFGRKKGGLTLAGFTSFVATVVLFSASIGQAVVFGNVNKAFNSSPLRGGDAKLTSSYGRIPTALSLVACGFSLAATTMIILGFRRAKMNGNGNGNGNGTTVARSVGTKGGDSLIAGGAGGDPYAAPGTGVSGKKGGAGGILSSVGNLIPGRRHKYVQVEAQPALVRTDVEGRQRGLDDELWGGQDEYSHPSNKGAGGSDSVPLVSLSGNKQTRDLNSAYEPYSSQTGAK